MQRTTLVAYLLTLYCKGYEDAQPYSQNFFSGMQMWNEKLIMSKGGE